MAKVRGIYADKGGFGTLLNLSLRPWRGADGRIAETRLTLWKPCDTKELFDRYWKQLPHGKTICVEAKVKEAKRVEGLKRELREQDERILVDFEVVEDDELVQAAARLALAAKVESAALGTLELDGKEYRTSRVGPGGERYRVVIPMYDDVPLDQKLPAAEKLVTRFESRFAAVREAVLAEALQTYNASWASRPMSAEQFAKHLKLESATFDHELFVYFTVGKLFEDHLVEVRFKDDGEVKSVALAG